MGDVVELTEDRKQDWSWKTGSPEKRERMAAYLEWLLTPAGERKIKTKKKLAESLGITPATLRNYASESGFQREMAQRARETARVDQLPDVLAALYEQATDTQNPRSVSAAKEWLNYLRAAEAASEPEIDFESLSQDELNQVIAQLLRKASNG